LHGEVQEAAICTGALHQLSREWRTLRHCTFAIQSKCRAASKGKPAPSEDRAGAAERPCLLVVTTDFFGFDTSDNHYKLKGLGDVSEMGDAVLGLVAKELGANAPRWIAIRNVSDPQIKADGLTLKQQAAMAAQIYKGFGRWSSVCSAITCWASVAAE
jgi:hypothetical protein